LSRLPEASFLTAGDALVGVWLAGRVVVQPLQHFSHDGRLMSSQRLAGRTVKHDEFDVHGQGLGWTASTGQPAHGRRDRLGVDVRESAGKIVRI
jgi:hypothetical protein